MMNLTLDMIKEKDLIKYLEFAHLVFLNDKNQLCYDNSDIIGDLCKSGLVQDILGNITNLYRKQDGYYTCIWENY